jgi:predicted deacetylase
LAIVPDNQDPELIAAAENPKFWECARRWQACGWTIGLHGYQHRFVTTDPGIMGKNAFSEFAGLPATVQEEKLQQALEIFAHEELRPDIFVAPAHSFDQTTIECLLRCGISCVSDGYGLLPTLDASGMTWLPQQLWEFKSRLLGVWSICLHINRWGARELKEFETALEAFAGRFTTVPHSLGRYPARSLNSADRLHDAYLRLRIKGGKSLHSAVKSFRRTVITSTVSQ